MTQEINIADYILESYVPAKLAATTLEAIFIEKSDSIEELPIAHGQEKCPQLTFPFARSGLVSVPVTKAQFLIAENSAHPKKVLEITLNTADVSIGEFEPGDTIAILPSNRKEDVQKLLNAMQLTDCAEHLCRLQVASSCNKKSAKIPTYVPTVTTPLELLRDCLNLYAVLKKQFLRVLAERCSNLEESAFLSCLSSKEATAHYNAIVLEKGLTLIQLLSLCPSCQPTLELLVEHLPRLLPRPYSIANSPRGQAHEIRIIFSVLRENCGLTTGMLASLATMIINEETYQRPRVLMYLRNANNFRYTALEASNSAQILIGVGTALAPFIGFLEHKQHLTIEAHEHRKPLGQTWLFAGATSEIAILHREQLLALLKRGILTRYFESLSRVPETPFHYVQEQLKAHAREFVELLMQPETILYLCADGAQISKSIETAICACIMQELHLQEVEATQLLKDFRNSGKFREDLWT